MSSSIVADSEQKQQSSFPFEETKSHSPSASAQNAGPSFALKASLFPLTCIELKYFDATRFAHDIDQKIQQAPDFFVNMPLVIGLEKYQSEELDFQTLVQICKQRNIKPFAVRGGGDMLQACALASDLTVMPEQQSRGGQTDSKERSAESSVEQSAAPEQRQVESEPAASEPAQAQVQDTRQISKIIHTPIRSGQQVYAADGDLIILSSVSAGAEVLADGNIHVYGALRGRALAGVKGDAKARIFCHGFGAELISIAGQYKISDDIPRGYFGQATQAYLDQDALKFKLLEL